MSKIMLMNVTHVEESRVAVVDDGVLSAYEIETTSRSHIVGNIHNVVVENVLPSLEAAFVKLGPDLKGFLPLDEVNFRLLPVRGETKGKGKITQHLHPGQRLMAQVVREPFGGKPPTVSTYFSLPGRFLVLMPGVDSSGISRKIEDPEQRERLKRILGDLSAPQGFGLIVRTAGHGQAKAELQRDLRYLLRLWESIQRSSREAEFPSPVYRERDLVIRTIRDYLTPDIQEVWIDSKETHDRVLAFVRDVMPNRARIVRHYTGDRPIFNKFNLEEQIESIYKRRVTLPSGGEIVIDGTEALTAIDVNTARSARKGDAEETALQTNLEAAAEIGRQLRLRDLGGLVVVDFIDLTSARNNKKVEKAMRDVLKQDRARYDVTRISKLGLMELARQRLKGEKMGVSYTTCPTCEGHGLVKHVDAAALAALRKLQTRAVRGEFGRIRLAAPPEVAAWILNQKREDLLQLERRHDLRVVVESDGSLLRHHCEIETFPREKATEPPAQVGPYRPSPPLPPDPAEVSAASAEAPGLAAKDDRGQPAVEEPAEAEAPSGRKRRRRRRRPRSSSASEQAPDSTTADAGVAAPGAPAPGGPEPTGAGVKASEPATTEPERGGADSPAEPPGEGAKKRRRKRRRRKSAGSGPSGNASDETGSAGGEGPAGDAWTAGPNREPDPAIPRGVVATELMPAATGDRARRRPARKKRARPSARNRGTGRISEE